MKSEYITGFEKAFRERVQMVISILLDAINGS